MRALRQVLLRQLPPERARKLHLRLGEALLEGGVARSEDQIEAGFHLILGGAEVRGADLVASAATKLEPRSVSEIAAAVRATAGPVSIGGGRYSMGGQTAVPGGLQIDMRAWHGVDALDTARRMGVDYVQGFAVGRPQLLSLAA